MRLLALVALGVGLAAADCSGEAVNALGDASFSWLLTGNSDARRTAVTNICASPSNPARDSFNARLTTLTTACIQSQTSAFGLTVNLLNAVLCEKHGPVGADPQFCVLSLLPLFDLSYFMSLSTGAAFVPPPLGPVADTPDRQNAMCGSSVCNAFIETMASNLIAQMPNSPETAVAAGFIRGTVSQMRCGCAVRTTSCFSTKERATLIVDTTATPTFIEANACDATTGALTACARTWANCQAVQMPACARTCTAGDIATIKFRIKNLNYDCLKTQLGAEFLGTIKTDVIAMVPGLLASDFGCSCVGGVGTECTCSVTCTALHLVRNLDLAGTLDILKVLAAAGFLPTPKLDELVSTCKLTPDLLSFGTSFELVSASTNFPLPEEQKAAASALTLGFGSIVVSFCLSLVL
jgi:hypothetical protein